MKVKILTGHSKKEQERRGLLVSSTRRHPGAMGAYWADTFFPKTEFNTSSTSTSTGHPVHELRLPDQQPRSPRRRI